ncbi:flavin monoamine oxidase family protein [Glutamicibacter sp. NPDC087344]|uniref:flavin monoamine oxidase family protein n=1 Tax=Glutamicibacter sp. NPDC087344 TaxID=3363994 RepID=UPI003805EA42
MNAGQEPRRVDVVVVGAGASGLAAAGSLAQAGLDVIVLEARDRVGGRARSLQVDGGVIDLGATWFWANEPRVQALAEQLNQRTFWQHLDGDAMYEGTQVNRLDGNPVDAPASRFAAGAQGMLEGLARRLPQGMIHLGEPATSITVDADGASVSTALGGYRCEQVVLAVPPALAAQRIAESTAVWMGGVVKAVAVYDRPFWRAAGLSGSAISRVGPFREFHDHSGPEGSPAAIFAFTPAAGLPQRDRQGIATAFREQLTRLFGPDAAHPQGIHAVDWSSERFTQPTGIAPADTSSFGHAAYSQPVHGRIHWASTETAPAFAGHLEGALLAGLRAAEAIRAPVPAKP